MARGIPLENLFQAMAVRLNGPKAETTRLTLNFRFTDLDKDYLLQIDNAVMHAFPDRVADAPDAMLTMASLDFKRMMMGLTEGATLIREKKLAVEGNPEALLALTTLFDQFERRYPIVTPRST